MYKFVGKEEIIYLSKRGSEVLNRSLLNKGTAFTLEEREELGLNGLLPPKVSTLEQQIARSYRNYSQMRTPLEKYQHLIGLMSRNELLFYQFAARHAAELLPIIYTPTVGDAAMQYSRIYFHQRGLYLSYPFKDKLDQLISNYARDDVDVIVATDGERILGLGDQGIGGMTIPIGKLSLYTLFGGIHPAKTLPILLDVGTNNQDLLNDGLYLGWNHERIRGAEYDSFINCFVKAIKKRYPKVLLQWEDFGKENARRTLNQYREEILSFNDDIQGTAAVALGALFSAVRVKGETLKEQRIVIVGAGSAGTGIADMIAKALVSEGLSKEEAHARIYLIDVEGLIHFSTKNVTEEQRSYVHSQSSIKDWDIPSEHISLLDVIKNAKPTVLIGVSAQAGIFDQKAIEEMALRVQRPIVFPLSNPTSKAECTPEDLLHWTRGKAIIATGSPFPPVSGVKISQCNNVYIFPGVGLGALGAEAKMVTDGMFLEAAKILSKFSPALKNRSAPLLPEIEDVRKISYEIAIAVAKKAFAEGVSQCSNIEKGIEKHIWEPHYPRYAITSSY